jgi:hypothetical protein
MLLRICDSGRSTSHTRDQNSPGRGSRGRISNLASTPEPTTAPALASYSSACSAAQPKPLQHPHSAPSAPAPAGTLSAAPPPPPSSDPLPSAASAPPSPPPACNADNHASAGSMCAPKARRWNPLGRGGRHVRQTRTGSPFERTAGPFCGRGSVVSNPGLYLDHLPSGPAAARTDHHPARTRLVQFWPSLGVACSRAGSPVRRTAGPPKGINSGW